MVYSKAVLFIVMSAVLVSCAEVPPPPVTPIIEFYRREGLSRLDCMIPMTKGVHKFKQNSCSNDDNYYFVIRNPREGYVFGIYNNPDCNGSESWASYRIRDPIPGMPTDLLSVDAAYSFPQVGPAVEIVRGIYTDSYQSNKKQLVGKVSCFNVSQVP